MKRAVLLCLALAACGVPQPTNEEVDPPPGADDAVEVAVIELSGVLGEELAADDVPLVRWFDGTCLDYGDECPAGHLAWAAVDREIHLVVRPSIHESALVHELMHWGLHESRGYYDGSHSDQAWGSVEKVRDVLEYLDL